MMALMANGVANLHRPQAKEKHKQWVVVCIVVSVALAQAEDDHKDNALQVKVETAKFLQWRNDLIRKKAVVFLI